MRRFLAWVAVATALVASRASATDNHLSGAYDSKRESQLTRTDAPKKSADDKTWLRRESATTAPYLEEAPSPYTEAPTAAPAPVKGGGTGVAYEGEVAAVIVPWEGRSAKSSGYSSSKTPTAKPDHHGVVEDGGEHGKATTDKSDDSPRDSAVPAPVSDDKGAEGQKTVGDKPDRAWYQRTSAPEPVTKTRSPYTDVYGEKTSSLTKASPSATKDQSSVKSAHNVDYDVDRRESEDSHDGKTAGHLSSDDKTNETPVTRPDGGKPSDAYAEKEAAPFDEEAGSSASHAPPARAAYKWGKDTSESPGDPEKEASRNDDAEESKKDVAVEEAGQYGDRVKETRDKPVSASNGKTSAPHVGKAGASPSYGEDSAAAVDAESPGYRDTPKTKPGRHVQGKESTPGTKSTGDAGSRGDRQGHEHHQYEPAVPAGPNSGESAGRAPIDGKTKPPHETSGTSPYGEKASASSSHGTEAAYDENGRIPSQEHSTSGSREKASAAYAEKGAAPFDDGEMPYGQDRRKRGVAAVTFPWGKKSSAAREAEEARLKAERHGYHAEDEGFKKDAAAEKDSEDNLVPESLDDDKWSARYTSTDRSAVLGKEASTTPVYSSRLPKTKAPDAKSPYDDSEDVTRGEKEKHPATATYGEHSNALGNAQHVTEGTSASKPVTDGTVDDVADADPHGDSESPGYPSMESTPLRLKRGRHIRDGAYAPAGSDAKVSDDIDTTSEDHQYSSERSRKRHGGGWRESIDGNMEAPYEQATAASSKEAGSRYGDKTSSQTTESSGATYTETTSPPDKQEGPPTNDEKPNTPPSKAPSALPEDAPKPSRETAGTPYGASATSPASESSEPHSATTGVTPDRGVVGVTVAWKAQATKAATYPSTDAPLPTLEYHEKTEDKGAVYRDALGPVIPWNGGKPQLVREQETSKPKMRLGSARIEGGGYSQALADLVPWTGGHSLSQRGLESEERPEDPVETPAEEPGELPEDNKPEEETTETPGEEPAEPSEASKPEEEPTETRVEEPVGGEEVEKDDRIMQTTTVSDANVRWDQDDCDPCEVPTLPPTLPPIHPHSNDDYMEHLPNVTDAHEAWKDLKENAPVSSDAPTKPPRKKAPKPCKEDLKHCTKVIGEDGERYECEKGYTLTPTEQPTERPTETPTEAPSPEIPTERPTETPTESPTEIPPENPTEKPYEAPTPGPSESTPAPEEPTPAPSNPSESTPAPTPAPTPGPSEPAPAPSQPSEPDEPTPAPSNPSDPTPAPTESNDEPVPTPAASTTEGDNGGASTPDSTGAATSDTTTPATSTGETSTGDTAYATGTSTTGEDANANGVGASTSEGNTSSVSSALGGGAIAGIVIACVVFAAVVVGAVLFKQRAIARQREENLFSDLSATGGRALETDYAAM